MKLLILAAVAALSLIGQQVEKPTISKTVVPRDLTYQDDLKLSDLEVVQLENVSLRRALNQTKEQLATVQQQLSAYQAKAAQDEAPKVNEQISGFLKNVCETRKIAADQCGGLSTKEGPDGKPIYSITPPAKQEAKK